MTLRLVNKIFSEDMKNKLNSIKGIGTKIKIKTLF